MKVTQCADCWFFAFFEVVNNDLYVSVTLESFWILLDFSPDFPLVNFEFDLKLPLGNLLFISKCPLVSCPLVLAVALDIALEEAVSTFDCLLEDSPLTSERKENRIESNVFHKIRKDKTRCSPDYSCWVCIQ